LEASPQLGPARPIIEKTAGCRSKAGDLGELSIHDRSRRFSDRRITTKWFGSVAATTCKAGGLPEWQDGSREDDEVG
jgi:hypothetical protein